MEGIDLDLQAVLLALWAGVAVFAAGHALLNKTDPRAAWGWIAVCWLFPFAGPALYFFFGINRVQRYAQELGHSARTPATGELPPDATDGIPASLQEVARVGRVLTDRPLLAGNTVLPLQDGEQVYPRMLEAIGAAKQCVCLATYIFDTDGSGRAFVDALAAARARGVEVRVLLDGIGECYSWPRASGLLRRRGVPVARFNPPHLLPPSLHINLRNHRKLLWVDGEVAFTGGLNIGDRHLVKLQKSGRVADSHFELRGPVLAQLAEAFAEDWLHASGERWQPPAVAAAADGDAACRVVTDGPHESVDALSHLLQAAISAARREVSIMTPYFLPPPGIASELINAALRGVRVEVFLPAHNNLPFVQWASRHALPPLLERGVRVYEQPAPFRHDKLFLVDGAYSQVGSANLDVRSLRLNFELNIEIHDRVVAAHLTRRFDAAREVSQPVTQDSLNQRGLSARLRDAVCWLFSPYL
jgi:cardiolipin synthase